MIKLTMNPEGYPSEECLVSIEKEEIKTKQQALELLRSIKPIWAFNDWGWEEAADKEKILFRISTAGWSGNEDIISALKANFIFWSMGWESSRRGGHYTFEFSIPDKV